MLERVQLADRPVSVEELMRDPDEEEAAPAAAQAAPEAGGILASPAGSPEGIES